MKKERQLKKILPNSSKKELTFTLIYDIIIYVKKRKKIRKGLTRAIGVSYGEKIWQK